MAAGVHPLNKDKFYEAINLYISGQASQVKAAKVAGCSVPTFKKYANKIYGGEELPDNLWGGRSDMCKLCEMIVKEALLDYSSKGIITLSLDGKMVRGVVSIDNISNIYRKDTAKEIQITLLADEVKVKLPNGEIKDISEI